MLTTNRFIRGAGRREKKRRERDLYRDNGDYNDRIFIVQSSWTDRGEILDRRGAYTRAFPRPFLIPSYGVLNSPLLPPLPRHSFAHRVFRITLASHISPAGSARRYYYAPFSAEPPPSPPPPPSAPRTPFGLGHKAGPNRRAQETLCLCSRALAIKRRPITIVIVVVITVVISKRASERASER